MKRMTHIARLTPLVLLLIVCCATTTRAYEMTGAGVKVGIVDPDNGDSAPAIGAHLEFEDPGTRIHLQPSVMFWNGDNVTGVGGNFDLYYHFNPEYQVTPYLGTGVALNHYDPSGPDNSTTKAGLNLFGGLRFPMSSGRLFVEGRFTAADVSQVAVLGGITFLTH